MAIETQEIERKLDTLTEELNRPGRINNGKSFVNLQISLEKLCGLLNDVRVAFKYVVFDAEATQRENEYLRKLLQEENR